MAVQAIPLNLERAAALLDVPASANDQQLRSAYLKKVQQHPPDRDPEVFEQIRDAYEQLRDPAVRAQSVLKGPDPRAPLVSLLGSSKPKRVFVGSQLWIELLREKRS
jgi:hypothetical protein